MKTLNIFVHNYAWRIPGPFPLKIAQQKVGTRYGADQVKIKMYSPIWGIWS